MYIFFHIFFSFFLFIFSFLSLFSKYTYDIIEHTFFNKESGITKIFEKIFDRINPFFVILPYIHTYIRSIYIYTPRGKSPDLSVRARARQLARAILQDGGDRAPVPLRVIDRQSSACRQLLGGYCGSTTSPLDSRVR